MLGTPPLASTPEIGFVLHKRLFVGRASPPDTPPNWVRFAQLVWAGRRCRPQDGRPVAGLSPIRNPQSRNWLCFPKSRPCLIHHNSFPAQYLPLPEAPGNWVCLYNCLSATGYRQPPFGFVSHISPAKVRTDRPNWLCFVLQTSHLRLQTSSQLALFCRGPSDVLFTITPFPPSLCPSFCSGGNWVCLAQSLPTRGEAGGSRDGGGLPGPAGRIGSDDSCFRFHIINHQSQIIDQRGSASEQRSPSI
jgi:hypothetical protein